MRPDQILGEFIDNLLDAQNLSDSFDVLNKAVVKLGLDGVTYTSIYIGVEHNPLTDPIFLNSESFNGNFLDHYIQAQFAQEDFTIKRILSGNLEPMDWWFEAGKQILTPQEQEVITVAREDYGLHNGISIPTMSTPHQIAGASAISMEDDKRFQQLLMENGGLLKKIIELFHHRVQSNYQCQKAFLLPLLETLSDKERNLLRFMATGLPLKVIEDAYGIDPGYAKNLQQQLYRKFKVRNGNQLNYLLGLHKIVNLL